MSNGIYCQHYNVFKRVKRLEMSISYHKKRKHVEVNANAND